MEEETNLVTIQRIEDIICRWNNKQVTTDDAIFEISKLVDWLPRWSHYHKLMSSSKYRESLKNPLTRLLTPIPITSRKGILGRSKIRDWFIKKFPEKKVTRQRMHQIYKEHHRPKASLAFPENYQDPLTALLADL